MEPPESSERLAWVTCCTVGAIVGLSDVPLVLLLPAESTHPLTAPWSDADELIEGVELPDEEAARRFDLDRTVGKSGWPPGWTTRSPR
jgi:hypothetical protein